MHREVPEGDRFKLNKNHKCDTLLIRETARLAFPMELVEKKGNIFTTEAEVYLIPVNCEGYMGAGLALECAVRHPDKEQEYKRVCANGEMNIGMTLWQFMDETNKFQVLFPTKKKFSYPSRLSFIESATLNLIQVIDAKKIRRIAIPRLGADLGKLDWKTTRPVVERLLNTSEHLENVEFWEFDSKVEDDLYQKLKVLVKRPEWHELKFLNKKDKENIYLHMQKLTDLSFMTLLSIKGISKSKLAALAEYIQKYQQKSSNSQLMLDLPNG